MTNTRFMTILDHRQRTVAGSARQLLGPAVKSGNPAGSPTLVRLLAESALHRAIFDACSVPIALIDLRAENYPVALVNPAFEACFGYGSDETQQRPLAELLFAGSAETARKLLTVPATRTLLNAARRDGSTLACEVTAGLVRAGDGEFSYAVLAFSTRAEQSEHSVQTALTVFTSAAA